MRIQCPGCRQRFNTTEDFMGKTVECGSCDQRFKIGSETVVAEKVKVYPGERGTSDLSSFGAVAKTSEMPKTFNQAHYSEDVNMAKLEPVTPKRVLATLLGLGIFVSVIASFLLTGGEHGSMKDLVTLNRYILAGFAALLAGVLLIYGMRKNRGLGVLLAFVFGAILISLPYFLPGNPVAQSSGEFENKEVLIEGEGSIVMDAQDIQEKYLREIGYGPIEKALMKHPKPEVVGIFLRGANRLLGEKITDSLYESTNKVDRGILYKRDEGALLLLTKQTISIEGLSVICGKFGKVTKTSEDLRLIDVNVLADDMVTSSSSAAFDVSNPAFYTQNLMALKSIDGIERLGAIKRLGISEPAAHRLDVMKELLRLLPNGQVDEQLAIVKALSVWSKPGEGAESAVLLAAQNIHEKGELDIVTMEFLMERGVSGGVLILVDLWEKDPVNWSDMFIRLGAEAEVVLLPKIATMETIQFVSACHILKKVGTSDCLTVLSGVLGTKEGQNQKTLKATIDEIQKRL